MWVSQRLGEVPKIALRPPQDTIGTLWTLLIIQPWGLPWATLGVPKRVLGAPKIALRTPTILEMPEQPWGTSRAAHRPILDHPELYWDVLWLCQDMGNMRDSFTTWWSKMKIDFLCGPISSGRRVGPLMRPHGPMYGHENVITVPRVRCRDQAARGRGGQTTPSCHSTIGLDREHAAWCL